MTLRLIVTLAIALIISACGGGGGGGGENANTVLEGTWKKSCGVGIGEDPNNANLYDEVTLVFTNTNQFASIKNYTDSGCTQLQEEPFANATIAIGNPVTTTGMLAATEIDSTIANPSGPFQAQAFDIFFIDNNNVRPILYFGDRQNSGDGTTAQTRPTTLDLSRFYIKE